MLSYFVQTGSLLRFPNGRTLHGMQSRKPTLSSAVFNQIAQSIRHLTQEGCDDPPSTTLIRMMSR